jgi:hypothetical protein
MGKENNSYSSQFKLSVISCCSTQGVEFLINTAHFMCKEENIFILDA